MDDKETYETQKECDDNRYDEQGKEKQYWDWNLNECHVMSEEEIDFENNDDTWWGALKYGDEATCNGQYVDFVMARKKRNQLLISFDAILVGRLQSEPGWLTLHDYKKNIYI